MFKPELLAPAGDFEKLKTALQYGADAVYVGGEAFSLRTACNNFSGDQLERAIDYVKKQGKRIYVATNIVMKDEDIEQFYPFVRRLANAGADAVIVSDLGALDVVKQTAPQMDIHISTQANTVNVASASMWHRLGAKRVVLARELTGEQMAQLRANTPNSLELEVFVHGAMCVSYSGRCLLSNYMTGRDANRGECAQPCRWNYALVEQTRPGEYMPVVEQEGGTYVFNSKDLCLIDRLPQLVEAGVSSLKIEGRVKSEYYVATVVKAYREELDRYVENPQAYRFDPAQLEELRKVSHRRYFHGFFDGAPSHEGQVYETSSYVREYDVVGVVQSCDEQGNAVVRQRNKFCVGDQLELFLPVGPFVPFEVQAIKNEKGDDIDSAPHADMLLFLTLPKQAPANSMLRKKRG